MKLKTPWNWDHLQPQSTKGTLISSISGKRYSLYTMFNFMFNISHIHVFQLNVICMHPHCNWYVRCKSARSSNQIYWVFFGVHWQFRKAPEGSSRKNEAEKQVLEAMSHRKHIDNSVKLIGKLLFGIEKGTEVLNTVRPAGSPLVDNWDCLKTMVLFPMIQLLLSTFLNNKHKHGWNWTRNWHYFVDYIKTIFCTPRSVRKFFHL